MVGWSHKVACSSAVARCIFHVRLPVAPGMPRVHGLARFGATGDVDPGPGPLAPSAGIRDDARHA